MKVTASFRSHTDALSKRRRWATIPQRAFNPQQFSRLCSLATSIPLRIQTRIVKDRTT